MRLFICSRKTYLYFGFIMAADCLRLPIFLLEATNTSNQLGTKFNDWKCFFLYDLSIEYQIDEFMIYCRSRELRAKTLESYKDRYVEKQKCTHLRKRVHFSSDLQLTISGKQVYAQKKTLESA